jgi:hypothetical protein
MEMEQNSQEKLSQKNKNEMFGSQYKKKAG